MTLALALLFAALDHPVHVEHIEVKGLWISQEFIVRRELPFKEGDTVTPEQWELALARLWNMGPFSRVDMTFEPPGTVVVTVEDRFTLNPLFSYGIGGGAFWVRAGLSDINLAGRYLELGTGYERYEKYNGFQAWIRDPRLLGRRIDGQVYASWQFRPQPHYFLLRRAQVRAEAYGESGSGLVRAGVWVHGVSDESLAVDGALEPPPPFSRALFSGVMLRIGRVDIVRIRQRGWSVEVWPGLAVSSDPAHATYPQFFAQALHFTMLGERWNLAFRGQVGATSNARPQDRFFLGGLDPGTPATSAMMPYASGIRGYEDGFIRTEQYVSFNAELRFVAFDWMWLAIMPAVFVDAAAARREVTGETVPMLSVGGGLRLLSPRLVATGVRGDIAVPLVGVKPGIGFSFGVYQFF